MSKQANNGLRFEGMDEVFRVDPENYSELIYYKKYGVLPSKLYYDGLSKELLLEKIQDGFELGSDQMRIIQEIKEGKKCLKSFLAILGDECMVSVPEYSYNGDGNMLILEYSNKTSQSTLDKIGLIVKESEENKDKDNLFLLSIEDYGMDFSAFEIEEVDLDIQRHYNEDFKEVDAMIRAKLNEKNEKGIVLIYGEPGTGKTSYIRHLISQVDKKMIYIPSDMSEHLASPKFIQLLSKNPNSIIIIEDAESVLVNRKNMKNSAIANLLNIADGLLSDCLNIQLICTFNIHISKIDNALLRKGRIIASYEMKKLSIEKSDALLKEKYNMTKNESLNLAEIFNYEKPDFDNDNRKVGFG